MGAETKAFARTICGRSVDPWGKQRRREMRTRAHTYTHRDRASKRVIRAPKRKEQKWMRERQRISITTLHRPLTDSPCSRYSREELPTSVQKLIRNSVATRELPSVMKHSQRTANCPLLARSAGPTGAQHRPAERKKTNCFRPPTYFLPGEYI